MPRPHVSELDPSASFPIALGSGAVQRPRHSQLWLGTNFFTEQQSEELILILMEEPDVVDVMHLNGNGDGLDELRTINIFGQDGLQT